MVEEASKHQTTKAVVAWSHDDCEAKREAIPTATPRHPILFRYTVPPFMFFLFPETKVFVLGELGLGMFTLPFRRLFRWFIFVDDFEERSGSAMQLCLGGK